jgi:hypothetical protein
MTLAILAGITGVIWIASYVITELLFGLYEVWKRRQQIRRALGGWSRYPRGAPGGNRVPGAFPQTQ